MIINFSCSETLLLQHFSHIESNPVTTILHPVYSVRYSVALVNSTLLTITLHNSIIATLVYNGPEYSVPFVML
jgi:hypothetical protein